MKRQRDGGRETEAGRRRQRDGGIETEAEISRRRGGCREAEAERLTQRIKRTHGRTDYEYPAFT